MKIKILFAIFFLSFLILSNKSFSSINNKIIVKIDNEIITSYDIKNKILSTLILSKKEINQKNINELKSQSLDALIQNKLKEIELSKFNFKDDLAQINSYLNSISSNDIEGLKNIFKVNNVDFNLFLNEIKNELKWRKLIYNKYSKKISIDPNIITQEINKIAKERKKIIEYNLSEIEILLNDNSADQNKIALVKKEISEFGFENSVSKFSVSLSSTNRGKIGWINATSLSNQILNTVKDMNIGDISEPIIRQGSVLFLKLNDKKISETSEVDLKKLKIDLINQKKNELFLLYSRSDLSKLRNTKLIEYFK